MKWWRGGFGQEGLLLSRTHLEFCNFLPDQEADLVPVAPRVVEAAPGRLSISACPARLLVVPSHRLGNIPVGNKPGIQRTTTMRCGGKAEGRKNSGMAEQGPSQVPGVGRLAGRWDPIVTRLGHLQSSSRPPCHGAAHRKSGGFK